jgi:succinate dehydrogenase/fumarate reductase cytochrome b subunit
MRTIRPREGYVRRSQENALATIIHDYSGMSLVGFMVMMLVVVVHSGQGW